MHLLTLTEPCQRTDGQTLEAGEYLVEDLNAAELLVVAERRTATISPVTPDQYRSILRATAEDTQHLIVHPGGYGDLMMLGPALRGLRRKWPQAKIHVCCRERSRCVFVGLDYPDGFVDYPLIRGVAGVFRFDTVTFLENCNEVGPDIRTRHAVDIKADLLGVDLSEDPIGHLVEYKVSPEELAFVQNAYPWNAAAGKMRIGVQLAASAFNRTYPTDKLFQTLAVLFAEGHEVLYVASPGSTDREPIPPHLRSRMRDLAADRLTFRQSAAAMATCDVVLTPDSAMMHVAGALGVPCLALFGPIDWKVRTAYYPTVRALQAKSGCDMAPCFFHQRGGVFWPKDGPCNQTNQCEALASIEPAEVVRRLKKVAAEVKRLCSITGRTPT